MSTAIDMTGKKIGRLTVLKRDTEKKSSAAYWICQCDCGNVVSVRGSNLRDKKTPTLSCGCLGKEKSKANIDTTSLVGKTFGRLTVLERDLTVEIGHGKESKWICQCKCGNKVSVLGRSLTDGKTKSCGCLRAELLSEKNTKDLTNQQFGELTVLNATNEKDAHKSWIWECKCSCGNIIKVSAERLLANEVSSCGCKHQISKGELKIKQILEENNINYKQQYKFKDCVYKNQLLFDFAIFDDNDNLLYLIEYDGEQHFFTEKNIGKLFYDEKIKIRDEIKNNYCKEHNIPLIRIPYTKYKTLSLQDILL